MIAVFTPTDQYGGLDVTWGSLTRQTLARELVWIVADEHLGERRSVYEKLRAQKKIADIITFRLPIEPPYVRNLSASYNRAFGIARDLKPDLFVSLQDYIWVPPDGVERFVRLAEAHPGHLYTGLASMADNPDVSLMTNPTGLYTIFDEPYYDCPEPSYWFDDRQVRGTQGPPGQKDQPFIVFPPSWEVNWAAISPRVLHSGLDFDVECDRGIGYDHQVYSLQAWQRLEAASLLDPQNHVVGLPHIYYFPRLTDQRREWGKITRRYVQETYGI